MYQKGERMLVVLANGTTKGSAWPTGIQKDGSNRGDCLFAKRRSSETGINTHSVGVSLARKMKVKQKTLQRLGLLAGQAKV
jgi:hypothetical protein